MSDFTIRPDTLRSDTPITIIGSAPQLTYQVFPINLRGIEPFEIKAIQKKSEWVAQFLVSVPGRYLVKSQSSSQEITVLPKSELTFFKEFGTFSILVFLGLGVIGLWIKHKLHVTAKKV